MSHSPCSLRPLPSRWPSLWLRRAPSAPAPSSAASPAASPAASWLRRSLLASGGLALLLGAAACGSSHSAATPPPASSAKPAAGGAEAVAALEAEANAAYAAKRHAACARGFTEVAAHLAVPSRQRGALYNAACCHVLAGELDAGFAALDRAVALGLRDRAQLLDDPDLAPARADPRWAPWLARFDAGVAAWEQTLGDAPLRRELLALVVEDQAARAAMIKDWSDPAAKAAVEAIDRRSTARLKEVVARHGWPSFALVGEDGAHAAWLLVQHADLDPAFQKECLAKMAPLVERAQASGIDYAYLTDRVAVAEGRPQRYGTQFDERREPRPIEDEANVDVRRAALGMPSMAAYRAMMLEMYGPPQAAPATPAAR